MAAAPKVINLSLGDSGLNSNSLAEEAVTYAYDHGVVVVQGAGNSVADIETPLLLTCLQKSL